MSNIRQNLIYQLNTSDLMGRLKGRDLQINPMPAKIIKRAIIFWQNEHPRCERVKWPAFV